MSRLVEACEQVVQRGNVVPIIGTAAFEVPPGSDFPERFREVASAFNKDLQKLRAERKVKEEKARRRLHHDHGHSVIR